MALVEIKTLDGSTIEVDGRPGYPTSVKIIGPVVRVKLSGEPVTVGGRLYLPAENVAVRDWLAVDLDSDMVARLAEALTARKFTLIAGRPA